MTFTYYRKLQKPTKSLVYDKYWIFANKRFEIYLQRLSNPIGPWTNDKILSTNKFTNVFRASDRVSQYLIKLQYEDDACSKDVFFKTILFKIFNKIETYEYLLDELGSISYDNFSFDVYDNLLSNKLINKDRIYSAAYIMPSAGSFFGFKFKHSNHLSLIKKMMNDKLYLKIEDSSSLEEIYKLLISYPSIGSFLAFQYAIDINYSRVSNFSEMDFVVAGPGAINGIKKCFNSSGDYSYEDIVRMMTDDQEKECERLNIPSPNLGGRRMHLIDCQNLFCEVDKYLRVSNPELILSNGRKRIKQKYYINNETINYFFPPKWNINN